jgi:hypothetical protein
MIIGWGGIPSVGVPPARTRRNRARLTPPRDEQARALAVVARALVARGGMRQARHAALTACVGGHWTSVLEVGCRWSHWP